MILSVNSEPADGYYTFVIQSGSQSKPYKVEQQRYRIVYPEGDAPWNVIAYMGEHNNDITLSWTVDDPDALLTTCNEVPAFR
jgi:hypothetical protein